MEIKKLLANSSNYSKNRTKTIQYIVIHYTANNGDTAKGNCNYFSTANRNASAHYFVDENDIYNSVEDNNTAWHCGASTYRHSYCRNNNAIGIEMCSRKDSNGKYFIKDEVITNTIELTKYLMKKYNIPVENVIRHYDVTGKTCPEPFVRVSSDWVRFKSELIKTEEVEEEEEMVVRYNKVSELPSWGKEVVELMISKGVFADVNNLNLTEDMIRVFVFNQRMGLYK